MSLARHEFLWGAMTLEKVLTLFESSLMGNVVWHIERGRFGDEGGTREAKREGEFDV